MYYGCCLAFPPPRKSSTYVNVLMSVRRFAVRFIASPTSLQIMGVTPTPKPQVSMSMSVLSSSMKPISGVVCWSQYSWFKQPVMSALKIHMLDHCKLFSCRYRSHSRMISLKVGSLTCWYLSIPRSRVYSEFSGIAPDGAFEQSRRGLPATLPGYGRQWYSLAQ
jgi:hypothetical protein